MGSKPQVEQPNHENIYECSYCHGVPHDRWDARGHAVEARSPIFKESIELDKRCSVQSFLRFGFRFKRSQVAEKCSNFLHCPSGNNAFPLQWPGLIDDVACV